MIKKGIIANQINEIIPPRDYKIFEIITYVSFGILLIIFLIIGIRYLIIKIIENKRNKKGGKE